MEDDIPGQEEFQKLFQTILGAKVGVKNKNQLGGCSLLNGVKNFIELDQNS